MSDLADDLELALSLADAADAITTARFRALDLRVESKPDLTPVTDADRDTEHRLRELLAAARPADAIHGEEFADTGDAATQVLGELGGRARDLRITGLAKCNAGIHASDVMRHVTMFAGNQVVVVFA